MVKIARYPMLLAYNGVLDCVIKLCRETEYERCGVIGGKMGAVFSAHSVLNVSQHPNAYIMDPIGLDCALEDLDREGNELVALYHSHLGDSAQPSSIDLDNASLDVPMIIISKKEIKAWTFKPDKSFEEFNLLLHNTRPSVPGGPIKALGTTGIRFSVEISGEVFQQLPGILQSYFGARNGPSFPNRMSDLRDLLQLASTTLRDLRNNDDPDAIVQRLLNDPNAVERMRRIVDQEAEEVLHAHNLIREQDIRHHLVNPITNPFSGVVGGTTATGGSVLSPLATQGSPVLKAPPHTHKYQKVQKSPDGHDIYECTFENCDKTLTIDGDIDIGISSPEESIKGLAESIAVAQATEAIIVEVGSHGKSEEGANPTGESPDPKA